MATTEERTKTSQSVPTYGAVEQNNQQPISQQPTSDSSGEKENTKNGNTASNGTQTGTEGEKQASSGSCPCTAEECRAWWKTAVDTVNCFRSGVDASVTIVHEVK